MSNIVSQTVSAIKNWWLFLLLGLFMILASAWMFFTPVKSYVALAWLFSVLVLASGLSNAFFSISNRKELEGWGWYLVGGLLEIFMGLVLIYYPEISLVMLPVFVGFWLMFRGAQLIGTSLELKKYGVMDWGWIMLLGFGLTTISFFMILNPLFGFLNVVYLTSVSLLLFGTANIMISLKLKKIKTKTIDKVQEFKKTLKSDLKELKKDVLKNIEDITKEQKEKFNAAFDEYESKINKDY